MNLIKKFTIDRPSLEIPWGIQEKAFLALMANHPCKKITDGHYRARCKVFQSLELDLDFHFKPRSSGRLFQIEFYRKPSRHRKRAFDEIQAVLEKELGPGVREGASLDGPLPCKWSLGSIVVRHQYYYQFGMHEKVVFLNNSI